MAAKLITKIFIEGTIECKTGLRVGGNKSSLEIGGVDLNIIKGANGVPYIPGSSLKGKLRSLLGKITGSEKADNDPEEIQTLFGKSGANDANKTDSENKEKKNTNTRLFVRDAILNTKQFKKDFPDRDKRDFAFSETKTENVIDRSSGKAQHPRNIERVPAGAVFDFNMVLDIYLGDNEAIYLNLLQDAFELIHYDYLGGHGSRGSGKVAIAITKVHRKLFGDKNTAEVNNSHLEEFAHKINELSNARE